MGAGLLVPRPDESEASRSSSSSKNERLKTMVQPEAMASSLSGSQRNLPWQERRPRCRKNYMMMSLPTKTEDILHMSSTLYNVDSGLSLTQSLNRRTEAERHRHRRKRLLKLLQKCTESIEGIISHSYVASMSQSCDSNSELRSEVVTPVKRSQSMNDVEEPLIILDDIRENRWPTDFETKELIHRLQPLSAGVFSGNKQFSELVLPTTNSDTQIHKDRTTRMMCSDMSSSENYDHRKIFATPKLRMGGSYSSSYVDESDGSSYLDSSSCENDLELLSSAMSRQSIDTMISRRTDSTLNQDYLTLMKNGQSTPFLSDDEDTNALSLFYEDEFDVEKSPLGRPIHDSDLEAAICTEYASLLHNGGSELASLHNTLSNVSSDFENIFPASSISMRSELCQEPIEETPVLEESVPNFTEMIAAKHDYQLTFGGTGSLYSEGKSSCAQQENDLQHESDEEDVEHIFGKVERKSNQIPKPPRVRIHNEPVHTSVKKVSFSDDVEEEGLTNQERMEEIENSTTWKEMKQNYTTWGQIKVNKEEPPKSRSIPDLGEVKMRKKKEKSPEQVADDERKRYSLTLWEMYKRAHSLSLSASTSELTTPEAFTEASQYQRSTTTNENLKQSINDLLEHALGGSKRTCVERPKQSKKARSLVVPDVSFLKQNKTALRTYNWWSDIFEQPSFCSEADSNSTCSQCDRRHSTDHCVIVFQGNGAPAKHKVCQMSVLNQIISPTSQCQCVREKLSDLSSGIATGSSGVTPREPSSWQHIAEFLKKRTRLPEAPSRGSINSTLSDQQVLDVVACIETADQLAKCVSQSSQTGGISMHEVLMRVWRLASALECLLSIGLKTHKYVSVAMGKIRTRVNIWDVVEESCHSAGNVTSNFTQIAAQISALKAADISMRFCLFVVGLLNFQCLDFWLQTIHHNPQLMDKYYDADSFMRSKIQGDRKLHTEVFQSLQPLSLNTWDLDYAHIVSACTNSDEQVNSPVQQDMLI